MHPTVFHCSGCGRVGVLFLSYELSSRWRDGATNVCGHTCGQICYNEKLREFLTETFRLSVTSCLELVAWDVPPLAASPRWSGGCAAVARFHAPARLSWTQGLANQPILFSLEYGPGNLGLGTRNSLGWFRY